MRSDRWYAEIFDSLFEEASKYTRYTTSDGPFTRKLWLWMSANSQKNSRQAILQILLHPHIRSFRVRAALGKLNWQSLFSDLESESLDKGAPNVAATYFLQGRRRPDSSVLQADMGYCGKAGALTFRTSSEGFGARRRLCQHRDEIRSVREKRARKKLNPSIVPEEETALGKRRTLWAHLRLAHEDIDGLSYCLLSVFPFLEGHDRILVQFHCLLTLAEAIDIIYLGTLVDIHSLQVAKYWGGEFGLRIRPRSMPHAGFEGLNRALPTRQGMPLYGMGRANWSPDEIIAVMDLFRHHESKAYGAGEINWDFVEEELRKNGVDRSRVELKSLYKNLSEDPESGLESWRSRRYKHKWLKIHHLKTFLEERQLVIPPQDEKDNYYHIPALEDGVQTFPQLEAFLRQQGYGADELAAHGIVVHPTEIAPHVWLRSFGALTLPAMLSKEVWEQIKRKYIVCELPGAECCR
jgi:hypothetical protein